MFFEKLALLGIGLVCFAPVFGQGSNSLGQSVSEDSDPEDQLNTITTAVPFALIAPDSRAGGMGDVGVATKADGNSMHWNTAKLPFIEDERNLGFSISYVPWLRNLVPDINLSYLSSYYRIDEMQTISGSLRYFSLGTIQFTNEFGEETSQFRPNEFAVDLGYGRKLSDKISGGIALRYIYSNLTGNATVQGAQSKPGQTVAADVAFYYQNPDFTLFGKEGELAFGTMISNIGAKMSYTETSRRDFIPINLRLGPRVTIDIDETNSLSLAVDINKLLVPTPPVYKLDTATGLPEFDSDGNLIILSGTNPDVAVANGMFGSFTDAPGTVTGIDDNGDAIVTGGSKFREEMREITYSVGLEYWYDNQFSVRTGYFHEHALKGNRKYFTLGAGLRYKVFGLDFSYLIPFYAGNSNVIQRSPLENTLRFSLTFDFASFKSQGDEEPISE